MNLAVCRGLSRRSIREVWFRAVRLRHAVQDPLATAHTVDLPSRYSPGVFAKDRPFETLYLAIDPIAALQEVEALLVVGSGIVPNWTDAWCVVPCDFSIGRVIDLTDTSNHTLLATSLMELTGHWKAPYYPRGDAPTQGLGEELFRQTDVEGVVFPAAKFPFGTSMGTNVVIFPERLATTSWVECEDAHGNLRRIP